MWLPCPPTGAQPMDLYHCNPMDYTLGRQYVPPGDGPWSTAEVY